MKAARFYNKGDIRIEEIPEPEAGPNEVLVAVEWCGLCGSDLHEYLAGPLTIPAKDRPHPFTKSTVPITLGHEFCGRVLRAPEGSRLKPGQAVVADPRIYCRACPMCTRTRDTNGCPMWGFLGLSGGGGGGLSSVVAVHESLLHVLPGDEALEVAALLEPLTVVWHAMRKCEVADWSSRSVLILGGGPIGVVLIQVLRANGASRVFVSEPTAERRALAEELADVAMDPRKVNVAERCGELTGGKGVDVVFDCAGVAPAMEDGMKALTWNGLYMNVALWETAFAPPLRFFMAKEITIKASMTYNDDDFRETVAAFAAGKFKDLDKMITSRIHLSDVVEKGFRELLENKDKHVKILVSPNHITVDKGHAVSA